MSNRSNSILKNLAAPVAALSLFATVLAQPDDASWHSIDGGGGSSAGGIYEIRGGIGQPDAARTLSGGRFALDGGYWGSHDFCPADFNSSGAVTVQDLFDFLSAWFLKTPDADFNGSTVVTVQDLFDFLLAWFARC